MHAVRTRVSVFTHARDVKQRRYNIRFMRLISPQQVHQVHREVAKGEHDHDSDQHLRRFPPRFYLSRRAGTPHGRRPVEPCDKTKLRRQ